jgi:hypothetical protein
MLRCGPSRARGPSRALLTHRLTPHPSSCAAQSPQQYRPSLDLNSRINSSKFDPAHTPPRVP